MLHPRFTPAGDTIGGTSSIWAAQIGEYGMWGDLQVQTRWGEGASGMYEAQWTMPLPPEFEHPILRRGTIVELMDGPWRVGSPLILTEPARGMGLDDPWKFVATGIGREVEGTNSWYVDDGTGATTSNAATAIDTAIANGLPWAGRDSSILTTDYGAEPEGLITIGALLSNIGDALGQRWGVGQNNIVRMLSDPTTPSYQVTPGVASLGIADDEYATVVKGRYLDFTSGVNETAVSPSSPSAVETRYGRREFPVDLTGLGAITASAAQDITDGILAKSKGRLGWTNGLTVTSNEILTAGGVPADLSKVAEDVGTGCMVRLHGIFNDLLDYNGQTWLDIIIGEATYVDGAPTITLNPLGLAARDLAHIVEEITGVAA